MFNSIRTRIAVPVIGVLVLLVVFIVIFVADSVQQFSDELTRERLHGAAQSAQGYLERFERYNEMTARAIAGSDNLAAFINEWNPVWNNEQERALIRPALLEYLDTVKEDFGVTSIVVGDAQGYIIARTHAPERYGDSTLFLPNTQNALFHGGFFTGYASTPVFPLGVSSIVPVWYDGQIIGTLSALVHLDRNDFVDDLAESLNAVVSIYAGTVSVASSIYIDEAAGIRAVGDEISPEVAEAVFIGGRPFDAEMVVAGERFHAYHFPLVGEFYMPVGVFVAGFSIEDIIADASTIVNDLIIIGTIGLVVAVIVMLFGIGVNASKVTRLADIVEDIANGGKYDSLYAVRVSKDEVGGLTSSIKTLVDKLKKLTDDRSIGEIQQYLDETQRSAIEAQAANKAKSDFLSTMSHEIRTPIGAILGITEIQLRNESSNPQIKEAFEKIYISGEMLLGIINDILDLSKIEAGKMELMDNVFDVASLISDTAQLNVMRIGGKPIKFEISVDPSIPTHLRGDELRIKQILNNILSNAFKYTDEGTVNMTVLQKSCTPSKTVVVYTIKDTGQGMTPEQAAKMFDEFTRFNLSANREAEGTGLGMSIAKNLVYMMRGDIRVKSAPGKGSTFTVSIPHEIAALEKIGKKTAENLSKFKYVGQSQIKQLQNEWEPMPYGKVLVVDDIDANIYVAKAYLAPYGLQIDTADSGLDAIKKVSMGQTYDIIFMDHMMPGMDGIEATRRIRDLEYDGTIIAFTANALVGQQEEFLEKGFNDFVSKPIQSAHLNAILNKYVRDKQPAEVIESAKEMTGNIFSKAQKVNYDELYKDFMKSQKTLMPKLRKAIKEKDHKTGHLLAHTLKTLAGLIGENELASLSSKVELSFRKEKAPDAALSKALTAEIRRVVAAINKKTTEAPKPKRVTDNARIEEILSKLEILLSENNAEAHVMLPEISAIANTEKIVNCIEDYDFVGALAELRKLR